MRNPICKRVSVGVFVFGLMFLGASGSWAQSSSSVAPSIKGAWRVVEVITTGPNPSTNRSPQPGLFIFTDKHFTYLFVTAAKPRPEIPAAKMTDKDRADAYNGFIASGGTYDIKGDQLTMNVIVARNAESMRSGAVFGNTYELKGNNLSITRTTSQNVPVTNVITTKLVRIE